tara:strand:- start:18791 stop:19000 length:210 start_codon:yes stop_codon:yes gene_type:complete
MTLEIYIKNLQEFVVENPEMSQALVVTSSDDEGNSYDHVHYSPSSGIYTDREFRHELYEDEKFNAVCVN